MRKSLILALLLLRATPAAAQITIPYPLFVAGTTISPDEVNANFDKLATDALNRTGGTLTGTLTTQAVVPDANNTRDLGASGTRFANVFGVLGNFSGALTAGSTFAVTSTSVFTGGTTFTAAAAFNNTGAASIDVAGGAQFGSGNVSLIDTTGKIPAISSTYFASVSGANLTSLPADQLSTGTVAPARLGSGSGGATKFLREDSTWQTVSLGTAWTSVSFNAGDYTAQSGNWTLDSGDVSVFAYTVTGKTMVVSFTFLTTTISATPTYLRVVIPGGYTAARSLVNLIGVNENVGQSIGFANVVAGQTYIQFTKLDTATFAALTNTTGIYGTITFEVQ